MEVKVLANPCESCEVMQCNTCSHELIKPVNNIVTRLPINPYVGFTVDFHGCKKIRANSNQFIIIGNVVSKYGGCIEPVGSKANYSSISLLFTAADIWRATNLVGDWKVETE